MNFIFRLAKILILLRERILFLLAGDNEAVWTHASSKWLTGRPQDSAPRLQLKGGSLFWSKNQGWREAHDVTYTMRDFLEWSDTKNMAQSIALDEYVLKMPLDIQIGSLGAENDNLRSTWKFYVFFFRFDKTTVGSRKLDPGSAELRRIFSCDEPALFWKLMTVVLLLVSRRGAKNF